MTATLTRINDPEAVMFSEWWETVCGMSDDQIEAMTVFARASDFSLTYNECARCSIEAALTGKDEAKRANHIEALLADALKSHSPMTGQQTKKQRSGSAPLA